jgi:uncharacterized protein (DUF3084 family)
MQFDTLKQKKDIRRTALSVTRWIGSPTSLVFHTLIFAGSFAAVWFGYVPYDHMLLVLTTIVSLEAIYLSIFIQMSINLTTEAVEDISEDVEEIQEDIGELQENVEDISEDVEEISEDVEEMTEDEIEDEVAEEKRKEEQKKTLTDIQTDLRKLMSDIERLRGHGGA